MNARNRPTRIARERDVTGLVVSGRLNKQVGGELGIAEFTSRTVVLGASGLLAISITGAAASTARSGSTLRRRIEPAAYTLLASQALPAPRVLRRNEGL